jgi:hypothetical protein
MMSAARARLREILLVAGGYSLFFTWFYALPLLDGSYLAESDMYEQYLPMFLAPAMNWSPYEFGGFPVFADAQQVAGYLPYLLFDDVFHWWTAIVISAHVLAACFTYAYVRNATGSRAAGVFAGAAYALSEAMVERIAHLTILHAIAWLPLILLSIDRVRETRRWGWVAIGALGLGQCFLSGHPQMALYTYYVAIAYAVVGGRAEHAKRDYVMAIAAMFAIGALITGIKSVPVMEASQFTARQDTSFSQFTSHANSPAQMLSAVFPAIVHEGREAPTYVGLVTLVLAVAGGAAFRRRWRAAFWVVVTTCGFMLGAGEHTPLAYVAYYIPGYDRFRVGARHLFLAAFGCAVLAGFALAEIQARQLQARALRAGAAVLVALLACGAVAMLAFPGAFQFESGSDGWALPLWRPAVWQQFAIAGIAIAATFWASRAARFGLAVTALIAILAIDTLQAIPYQPRRIGVDVVTIPAAAVESPSVHAERLAATLRPGQQRLLAAGGSAVDAVAPAAFARVWRIPSAGGYNPMVLGHYAALTSINSNGGVRAGALADADRSLDLLAVRYLLVRDVDLPAITHFQREGLDWNAAPLDLSIGRADCGHSYARTVSLPLPADVEFASIGLVTFLRCSEDVPHGAEVASVHLVGEGEVEAARLRAGVDTGETGLWDAGLRARAKHGVARVFGDDPPGSPLIYYSRIELPSPVRARRLELRAPGTGGWAVVRHLTLVGTDGRSYPITSTDIWRLDAERWKEAGRFSTSRRTDRGMDEAASNEDAVTVFENRRAMPYAWIVTEVVAMAAGDAVETIQRSQRPDGRPFDPERTAFVEPGDAPPAMTFSGGPTSVGVERPADDRIRITARTASGGFLVVSETSYPGWRARVNGEPTRIYRANVALQGVVVPAGTSIVEFEFVPRSLQAGWALSLMGAIACVVLVGADAASVGRRRSAASVAVARERSEPHG